MACSRAATACSLVTVGKSSRNSDKGLPCFEVIEQRRERYTGADKHGRATHDLRVAVNDRLGFLHLACPLVTVSVKVSLSQPLQRGMGDKRGTTRRI